MPASLPVAGWESEQVTYQHLIRPVVAFVRDHGPVPVERVHDYIATTAAGDLNFASPTKDRGDAARRTLNLLVQDLDAFTITDDIVSTVPDLRTVNSALFGLRDVQSQEVLEADRESSRRQRLLREWAGRGLFRSKWHNGIPRHTDQDITWMVDQIRQYGYVGPKIIRDADTGAIINGGLRVSALRLLGIPFEEHVETVAFTNDLHRLSYILAAHAVPGGKSRVPVSLRDAILREVAPRGEGILRKDGRVVEPSPEDWLAITGRDFMDSAEPREPLDPETPTLSTATDGKNRWRELIMNALEDGEEHTYEDVLDGKAGPAVSPKYRSSAERSMRQMAADGTLYSRMLVETKQVVFRRPASSFMPTSPAPRAPGSGAPRVGMEILVEKALEDPEGWTEGYELDDNVTHLMGGKKKRAAQQLTREDRGRVTFLINGERWRPESKKDGGRTWLRAVRV